MNEKNQGINQAINQKSNQSYNQASNQEPNQAAVENSEFKTVVNGKVVSVNQAQAALEAQEAAVTKTGIQEAHSNHSEPVQAGQQGKTTASSNNETMKSETKIKQVNVQSGQSELETHMNQAGQSEAQKMQAEAQQQVQQSAQAAQAKAKATGKQAGQ
ncbi:hypothetical protein J7E63_15795 [Bacillus sp. ISL-75]|uniref:hypothetical protein n=1 Tax=Bacillus sp. ISL-75 TaxID=2819137 RepID=UPI001BE5F7E8|nr:hypothetical protein [Bacillus sp. ISL-75]MBT2728392.1 hypothetical protein [Bacillus sp. ISL-75]